jgi:cytochrome P450
MQFKNIIRNIFNIPNLDHIPGPRGIAFFKLMLNFKKNSLEALEITYREYGAIVSYPWPISTVIIYDTKLIKQVLIDKNQIYIKGTQTEKMVPVLGSGLVTNNDRPTWMRNRVIVSKEMNTKAIRGFSIIILDQTQKMIDSYVEQLKNDKVQMDLSQAMRNLTFAIAGKTLLGTNLTSEDAKEVDAAVLFTSKMAHEHMFSLLPIPYGVPTPKNLKFHYHCRNLNRIVYRLIKEEKKSKDLNDESQSIIGRLIHAINPETGLPLNDKTLRDEVLTLLIAGYETTANTLIWILALIAKDFEIQKQIQDELDRSDLEIESLEFSKTFPTLYCSILEGIRLYTTIPMSSRKTTNQDYFNDYLIPKNTSVVIPVWVIHRHHDFWPDSKKFDPRRFINVDINMMDNYLPFSKGGRRCVGEAFAIVEVAIIIKTILKSFNIKLLNETFPNPVSNVSLKPDVTVNLIIEKR